MTAAQQKALVKLQAQQANGWPTSTKLGNVATGCNTTVLHGLRQAGLIKVSRIFLHGHVTTDIEVVS